VVDRFAETPPPPSFAEHRATIDRCFSQPSVLEMIRALEAEERRARTPLIILTANALPDHVEAALSAGADGHLAKPITMDSLFDGVAAALEAARPAQDRAA
jgi:CheY-like chemotaxis protein